jgi:hypothetical protein
MTHAPGPPCPDCGHPHLNFDGLTEGGRRINWLCPNCDVSLWDDPEDLL